MSSQEVIDMILAFFSISLERVRIEDENEVQVVQLTDRLESIRQATERTQSRIHDLDEYSRRASEEIAELRLKIENRDDQLQQAETRNERLQERLRDEIPALVKKISELQARDLQSETLRERASKVPLLQDKVRELRLQLYESKDAHNRLQVKNERLQARASEVPLLQDKVRELQLQVNESKEAHRSLQIEIERLRARASEVPLLQDKARELQLQLDESKDTLHEAQNEYKSLERRALVYSNIFKRTEEHLLRRIDLTKAHYLSQIQILREQMRVSHSILTGKASEPYAAASVTGANPSTHTRSVTYDPIMSWIPPICNADNPHDEAEVTRTRAYPTDVDEKSDLHEDSNVSIQGNGLDEQA